MQTIDVAVLALGAVIFALMLAIAPDVTATANGAASEPYSFTLSGLGRNATNSPEEDLPVH